MPEKPAPKRPKPQPNIHPLATATAILRASAGGQDNLENKPPCQIWLPQKIIVPPAGALSAWIFRARPALERLDLGWLLGRLFWPGAANARAPREDSPVLQSGWHIDGDRRILRRLGPDATSGHSVDLQRENLVQPWQLRLVADGVEPKNMRWTLMLAGAENTQATILVHFQGTDAKSLPQISDFAQLLARQLQISYISSV